MITTKSSTGDVVIGGIFVIIAVYVMSVAVYMPDRSETVPGPGFFPFWAGLFLALVGAMIAWQGLKALRAADHKTVSIGGGQVVFSIVVLIAFGIAIELLGFFVSASLFLFALFLRLSRLGPIGSAVAAVVATVCADLFFRDVLGLYLPPDLAFMSFIPGYDG